jgi:hypothetical protein
MYAWINFVIERNEHGQPSATLKPGDEVTQQDLGVSDEDWQQLIEGGSVRPQPYPKIPDNLSPAEHFRNQEGTRAKGLLTEEQVQERSSFQLPT